MSRVGSPSTATRSARWPAAILPSRPSSLKILALPLVAARIAASGVIPLRTIASSSRTLSPCEKTPTSPPKQIVTPAASAARKAARLCRTRDGTAFSSYFHPSKYSA